jgi:hypothetical protein
MDSLFGRSVAVSDGGEFVVIGAPDEKAVYIFTTPVVLPTGLPGYTQVCKITHTDVDFGWSVDISSNTEWLVIGAPGYNNDQGRVHIFSRSALPSSSWAFATVPFHTISGTGTLQKSLTSNLVGHRFGHIVSVNNGAYLSSAASILVGCPNFTLNNNVYGINSGAAFHYAYTGGPWVESILIPSDAEQQDRFGWGVSLSSDGLDAVISSLEDEDNGVNSGSAYVYTYSSSWTLLHKLLASDGHEDDKYGHAVSIGKNGSTLYVAIGAPQHNNDEGAIYLYNNFSGWEEQKIVATDALPYGGFGFDVSLNKCGSMLVASSTPRDYSYETYSGFARILTRKNDTVWSTDDQSTFMGLNYDDGYGFAVDMSESGVFVGVTAPYDYMASGYARGLSLGPDCYNLMVPCGGEDKSSSSSSP